MSGMPLETCWAFSERWNNKFYYKVASCWLFLMSHTTMHGSMNVKVLCTSRLILISLSLCNLVWVSKPQGSTFDLGVLLRKLWGDFWSRSDTVLLEAINISTLHKKLLSIFCTQRHGVRSSQFSWQWGLYDMSNTRINRTLCADRKLIGLQLAY